MEACRREVKKFLGTKRSSDIGDWARYLPTQPPNCIWPQRHKGGACTKGECLILLQSDPTIINFFNDSVKKATQELVDKYEKKIKRIREEYEDKIWDDKTCESQKQEQRAEMQANFKKAEETFRKQCSDEKQKLQAVIDALKAEGKDVADKIDAIKRDLEKDYLDKLSKIRASYENEDALKAVEERLRAEFEKERSALKDQISKLQAENDQLQKDFTIEKTRIMKKHSDELDALKTDYERKLAEASSQVDADERKRLIDGYEKRQKELKDAWNKDVNDLNAQITDLRTNNNQIIEKYENERKEIDAKYAKDIKEAKDLTTAIKENWETERKDLQKKIDDLQKANDDLKNTAGGNLDELRKKHAAEIKQLRSELDSQINTCEVDKQAALSRQKIDLDAGYAKGVKEINDKWAVEIDNYKKQISTLTNDKLDLTNRINDTETRMKSACNKELADLKNDYDARIAALEKQKADDQTASDKQKAEDEKRKAEDEKRKARETKIEEAIDDAIKKMGIDDDEFLDNMGIKVLGHEKKEIKRGEQIAKSLFHCVAKNDLKVRVNFKTLDDPSTTYDQSDYINEDNILIDQFNDPEKIDHTFVFKDLADAGMEIDGIREKLDIFYQVKFLLNDDSLKNNTIGNMSDYILKSFGSTKEKNIVDLITKRIGLVNTSFVNKVQNKKTIGLFFDIINDKNILSENLLAQTTTTDFVTPQVIRKTYNNDFYYINKAYAMFCLRNDAKLNKENLWGLLPLKLLTRNERFTGFDEIMYTYWGTLATSSKAIIINKSKDVKTDNIFIQDDKTQDYTKILKNDLQTVWGIWGSIFDKAGISVSSLRSTEKFGDEDGFNNKFFSNSLLLMTGYPVIPNNNAFSVYDMWDMFYEGFKESYIIQKTEILKLAMSENKLALVNEMINDPIHYEEKHQFWVGSAPFCAAKPEDCRLRGGDFYRAVREKDITDEDRLTYGSGCWSGNKVLCRLDHDAIARSGVFQKFGIDPNSGNFSLKWFGTAPSCDGSPCDAILEGYVPVLSDAWGDGAKCVTGQKFLGIRPNKMQKLDEDYINSMRQKCTELDINNREKWNAIVKDIFDTGSKIIQAAVAA